MLGRFFSDYLREDEADAEILDELAPRDDEVVIRKKTYDAFLDTPLEAELRRRGVRQVVIAGVLTHMCCETTARTAFCRGFEVYLPVDGSASRSEALHLGSLTALSDAAAVPTSTEEVLELCGARIL